MSAQNFGGAPGYLMPSSKVELSVSAKNLRDMDVLSKSDPRCLVYAKEANQGHLYEVGRTEILTDCLNPKWVKKFEMDYRFEERQILKFKVFDWDTKSDRVDEQDSLGEFECSLGEIMAFQGSQLSKPLNGGSGGLIIISGEELSSSKENVTLTFKGSSLDKKDFFGKSDPFLTFYRSAEDNSYTVVHKTEVIQNNLNPVWKSVKIPARTLCQGDYDRTLKIECSDWDSDGTHDLIGECFTNLRTLKEGSGVKNTYSLISPKKKAKKRSYKDSGKLVLTFCSIVIEPSFLDYIRGGLQVHFTVAVDFTASNGDPAQYGTLHYRQPGVDNQYIMAIKSVGEIVQDYDTDKLFPALGFGAQIPPTMQVSHEFFLNGRTDSPFCEGVPGILQAYENAISTVRLYGPTNFAPVIRHVMQFSTTHQDGNNYFVLLILTDGVITDLNETRKALVEASSLPMSVIIVGVGRADFSAMEMLDGDDRRLSAGGVFAQRDIVQFVELRKHLTSNGQHSKAALAKDVLAEIPLQLVSWMKSRNFEPRQPTQALPVNTYGLE